MQIVTTMHNGLEHHATLHGEVVIQQSLPEALSTQLTWFMGQEAQMAADVETKDGHVMHGQMAGRTEHGAVATQDNRQVWQAGSDASSPG